MGRPSLPLGTSGKVLLATLPNGRVKARVKFRDYDGRVRLGGAGGPSSVVELERPWVPATCSSALATCSSALGGAVWSWCDDVVAWINHEYAWRPAQMIPACWPRHPHIAGELPVLAVLRWTAENAAGPDMVEEWNRYAFPLFSDRMAQRLGESTCRAGKHQDWPTESRYTAFLNATGLAARWP